MELWVSLEHRLGYLYVAHGRRHFMLCLIGLSGRPGPITDGPTYTNCYLPAALATTCYSRDLGLFGGI